MLLHSLLYSPPPPPPRCWHYECLVQCLRFCLLKDRLNERTNELSKELVAVALCRFCLLGTSQHAPPPPLLCDCVRRVESLTYGTLFSPHVLVASVVVIVIANATLVRTKNVEGKRGRGGKSICSCSLCSMLLLLPPKVEAYPFPLDIT